MGKKTQSLQKAGLKRHGACLRRAALLLTFVCSMGIGKSTTMRLSGATVTGSQSPSIVLTMGQSKRKALRNEDPKIQIFRA